MPEQRHGHLVVVDPEAWWTCQTCHKQETWANVGRHECECSHPDGHRWIKVCDHCARYGGVLDD